MEVITEVTTERLSEFDGGQVEIQNLGEKYLYRGEAKNIAVEDGSLVVEFLWLAEGEGFPPLPERWVKDGNDENLHYTVGLEFYFPSKICDGHFCLCSLVTGETVIFFMPGENGLDPAEVEGLTL